MNLQIFKEKSLFEAMKNFFQELNVPISVVNCSEIYSKPGNAS